MLPGRESLQDSFRCAVLWLQLPVLFPQKVRGYFEEVPRFPSNEVPGLLGKTLVEDGEGDQLFCEIPGVSVEDFSGRTGDLLVDCFEGVGSLVEG